MLTRRSVLAVLEIVAEDLSQDDTSGAVLVIQPGIAQRELGADNLLDQV